MQHFAGCARCPTSAVASFDGPWYSARVALPPIRLDLRGVPCPLTWARAKVFLEGLATGAVVEVVTDDERSARDLPAAAEAEGYAVLKTEPWGPAKAVAITIER